MKNKLRHYGTFKDEKITLVREEYLDKSKVTENHISGYLLYRYELKEKLSSKLQKIEIEDYDIKPYVNFRVLREGESFYIILNFSHRIILRKSMLETGFKEDDEFVFKFNDKIIQKVSKILKPNESEIKDIENYLRNKYKLSEKIDYEQSIIKAENGYLYLPQFCYKVFNFSDIKGTDISKKIMEKIRLSNEERLEKIKNIIKGISFIEKEPLKLTAKKLDLPDLILKNNKGEDVPVKATHEIFKNDKYYPLKNKIIKTYIIIDNDNLKSTAQGLLKELEKRLEINFNYEYIKFENKILDKVKKEDDFGLAIVFGIEKNNYEKLKSGLLDKNIISQFIKKETIEKKDKWKYAMKNLVYQIPHKIGIRYFALKSKIPYDYIIGFDVSRKEKVNWGDCAIIYDSSGTLKDIVPLARPQKGEKIEINDIIEKLKNKGYVELESKKFLILRDGRIYKEELEGLEKTSKDYACEFLIIGIIKSHPTFIISPDYGIYLKLGKLIFLLPHKMKYYNNEKPLKIEQAYLIKNGEFKEFELDKDIIQILYNLTRLNYACVNYKDMSIKCPAPIHYVDKFLRFLHTSKEPHEEFLKRGFLYFI